jgi:hypothetical protein
MGAVIERLDVDVGDAEAWPGMPASPDSDRVELLLTAAKALADEYLNNPFEDDDGLELAIPDAVKVGVLVWVSEHYQFIPSSWNVTRVRTGDLEEWKSTGGANAPNMDPGGARPYWEPHRLVPL